MSVIVGALSENLMEISGNPKIYQETKNPANKMSMTELLNQEAEWNLLKMKMVII